VLAVTGPLQTRQARFERLELCDALTHRTYLFVQKCIDGVAGLLRMIGQPQEIANRGDGNTQLPGAVDERETFEVVRLKVPIAVVTASRRRLRRMGRSRSIVLESAHESRPQSQP